MVVAIKQTLKNQTTKLKFYAFSNCIDGKTISL